MRKACQWLALPRLGTALAVGALFALAAMPAKAASYSYQGGSTTTATPTSGNFSGSNFAPPLPSGGTAYDDTLSFGGSTYTATDDLSISLNLNALTFNNSGTVTLARTTGGRNAISLGSTTGGTTPTIIVNKTGAVVNALDLSLTANTTFNIGSGGFTANCIISGVGALTKSNTGSLTLSGLNTYTGATFINGGPVTVGVASVLDAGGANVSGAFGNNSALTLADTSGVGISLTNVVGNNPVSYSTQVGSLAGGGMMGGRVTLGTATLTTGGNNTSTVFAGVISGAGGALAKTGTGTQTLTGANTYTGGTTITAGTLSGTTTPTASSFGTGTIVNNATLDLGGGTGKLANTVSGGGRLTVGGNAANLATAGAVITMTGTNTYTGGTTVNAPSGGTTTLSGNAGSYGSGDITVNSGATVDYTQSGSGTAANNISGAGSVTFGGNATSANGTRGTINYTGQDSAAGGTTVSSSIVILNHTGGGALTGPVAVATGGVVQLGSDNQIATVSQTPATTATSNITLSGGTLNAAGHSDGAVSNASNPTQAAVTSHMGTLTLGGGLTSTFDFGLGSANSIVAFADSSGIAWNGMLNIINYTGATDALYIGNSNIQGSGGLTPTQLGRIRFNGLNAVQRANGQLAAAPEPSQYAAFGIGVLGLGALVLRAKKRTQAAHAKAA